MTDLRENRIKELFNEALELDQSAREAFLDRAADDCSIGIEVRVLIESHERAGDFLADPTADGSERPGQIIGRYKLLSLIGEGGFGSVYLAEQSEPVVRKVALKIIKLGMDTKQVIARFEAERQTLALMDHPNIATVFDAGATVAGRPYFVMELVNGVPITEYCDHNHLTIFERLELFRQVCSAVQHAHTKGVIHRDIKPSNVLVSRRGDHDSAPLPKIIDFGIAKATSGRLTQGTVFTEFRQLIGTPEYMSPEQADINAADIDTRSDVYSLGVLLYELLAGATPFDVQRLRSAQFNELQRIIREEEPPKPSTRLSSLSSLPAIAAQRDIEPRRLATQLRGDLDWITLKALDKAREHRYGSAAELAEDIRRHLSHEPVLARSPTATYRVKKFVRRHRAGVLAGALIALAVVGGAVGTTIGMVRARDSAQRAGDAALRAAAVNEFMRDVLTSVEPDARGADVRLVEVLNDASRTAAQRFAGQPDQEGLVRVMLGQIYTNLDLENEATAEFQRAVALLQSTLDPTDRRLLYAQVQHARALLNITSNLEAQRVLEGVLPRIQRALGPNDNVTIEAERLMVGVLTRRGEHEQAMRDLRALRQRADAVGADDNTHIGILNSLILALRRTLYRDGVLNEDVRNEIETLAREMVERGTRQNGPDGMHAVHARTTLADMMWRRGDFQGAADICTAILATSEERLGRCHGQRLLAMGVLAEATHRLGDSATAADLRLKEIDCTRSLGANMVVMLSKISDALPFLDRGGRWSEGEALSREYAAELRKLGGGHGDMLFEADAYVARFVSLQGRLDEAEQLFQTLLLRADQIEDTRARARLLLFVAGNLIRQGSYEQAERQLQAAASLVGDIKLGTCRTNSDDIIAGFASLYVAWGKPERAKAYEQMRAASVLKHSN